MSYSADDSDLNRVREIVGDTNNENELFPDAYYTMLLTHGTVRGASIAALRRILGDPYVLLKKYAGFGPVTISDLSSLKRTLLEEIDALEKSALIEASSTNDCFPEESVAAIGESTDSDGVYKTSDIETYLSS